MQIKRLFASLTLLFLCLFFNFSCKPTTASNGKSNNFFKYELNEAKFDLGDTDKFDFTGLYATTDGNGRLLVQYKKLSEKEDLGLFLRLSEDGGNTFGKEYKAKEIIKSDQIFEKYSFHFIPNGFAVVINVGKNFYYSQSIGSIENWRVPILVNDEQDSFRGGVQLLHKSENEVYCLWIDNRRGFDLIFFSSSFDGGKIWSASHAIDYDFREGNQQHGKLVLGDKGRLHAVWTDWRDRKTLVDIRYSYSDDKGVNWSESIKLNDDEMEVWQHTPTVIADGTNIYVAFSDFRDEGEEGDNDWNVYFVRSINNGTTWGKNKRLNDVKEGVDGVPKLSIDKQGNLYCIWESARETLFGQIVFSYSNNKGEIWSPSVPVSSNDEMAIGEYSIIENISPNKILMRQGIERNGKLDISYSYLEKTSEIFDSQFEQKIGAEENPIIPINYELGETLFQDDFSKELAEKWKVNSGVWSVVGGTYMGVFPNQHKPFVSYAKFEEPEKYILMGRFRFDAVAHNIASLNIRGDKKAENEYVISNRFRKGAWLSFKEPGFKGLLEGNHMANGKSLVQKRYPFRQDRWYKFTLVVTPEQLDYYVDGNLMLSYEGDLGLKKGKIGIGGYRSAPTYFDDIKVSELK